MVRRRLLTDNSNTSDHRVDDMGLSTDRNPTKSPDLVKAECRGANGNVGSSHRQFFRLSLAASPSRLLRKLGETAIGIRQESVGGVEARFSAR